MPERIFWIDSQKGSTGVGPTYGENSFNNKPINGRIFKTMKEVKETFFPNIPIEELIPERSDEETQEDLKRIIRGARRNARKIDSKKAPR